MTEAAATAAAAALRASEERLRLATDAAGIGIWVWNLADDSATWENERLFEMFGVPIGGEAINAERFISEVVHPEDRARFEEAFAETLRSGARFYFFGRFHRGDTGELRWAEMTGQLHRALDGTPQQIVGTGQDVTERQVNAERLVRAAHDAERTAEAKRLELLVDNTAQTLAADALQGNAERLRFLDTLGQATRSASDPAAVLTATTERLGRYLGVTRCAYADVESDSDRFTIRDDWTVDGAVTSVGTYSLDRFGPRAVADMHAGRTLVVGDVDVELTAAEGGEMFSAIGVKAIICCPLVKDGRLVAMMAVHQSAPRAWSGTEAMLVQEVVERSWAHIERVRASVELREMDRRKDEFLATLAHELRNPLAPIRTGLQVLKVAPSGPIAERARATMERQLAHMVRLIDDLLDISRISLGKLEVRQEPIELRAVVEHAVEASRPLVEAMGQVLEVRIPEQRLAMTGDLTRLAQVLSNLLDNSAKYTPRGGRIQLIVEELEGSAIIRVTDNGVGIAAEVMPGIFDLFSQANRTLTRARGGLGIGLSLARRLTELHGGTVTAESAGIGHGSTFTVRLPLEEAAPLAVVPDAVAGARATGRRVLVVDDNVDGAEMLAMMLTLEGHHTRTAYDGPSALAIARELLPEVVFLDIGLPGMDGYEVARQLRVDARLKSALLVAVTGWGSADDKRRTKEAGFDAHLTKPVASAVVQKLLADLGA